MPQRSADAICSRIAAADYNNIFSSSINETAVFMRVQNGLRVRLEKIHREVNAFQLATFNPQIARFSRTGGEHNGIKIF